MEFRQQFPKKKWYPETVDFIPETLEIVKETGPDRHDTRSIALFLQTQQQIQNSRRVGQPFVGEGDDCNLRSTAAMVRCRSFDFFSHTQGSSSSGSHPEHGV